MRAAAAPAAKRPPARAACAQAPRDPTTDYANAVAQGAIVAGPYVRAACRRHLSDLRDGAARGLVFDLEAAETVFDFFHDVLVLPSADPLDPDGAKPFRLAPAQQFIVGCLFGWMQRDDESGDLHRRFRVAYIEMGKGNGKTPLAAGIALYMLRGDKEPAAEVYFAAVNANQARIGFTDASNYVKASSVLASSIEVMAHALRYPATHSFCRYVSSQAKSLDGKRVHCAIIDELHEHDKAEVSDKMRAGTKGRRQAMVVEITNSGHDRHSVCWAHHEFSKHVVEGVINNDAWFAYVCALDEGDDPFEDEACWIKANPNLGVSITRRYLREQVEEARKMPLKQNLCKRLNFCIWTEAAEHWLDMGKWDAAPTAIALPNDAIWHAGLDLSTTTDLTAFVLVAQVGRFVAAKFYFWLPNERMRQRVKRDLVPYDVWAREGLITLTVGDVIDYEQLREDIKRIAGEHPLGSVRFDAWNATQITQQLADDGLPMMKFGQGFASMSAPSKELERLVMGGLLAHGHNPVMRWQAANAVARMDPAGNVKPDKERSREKIDGIVALIMAIAGLGTEEAPDDAAFDAAIRDPLSG